jgi:hypothetical protein
VSRGTQEIPRVKLYFAYRIITVYDQPFHTVPLYIFNPMSGSYNPRQSLVWAFPRSLAATDGISKLISIPAGTKMFQFPAFAFITYELSNK